MDDFETMVLRSLDRIEKTLDKKVDSNICQMRHSKTKDFQTWLSILLSMLALFGVIYSGIKYIEQPHNQDKVALHGK